MTENVIAPAALDSLMADILPLSAPSEPPAPTMPQENVHQPKAVTDDAAPAKVSAPADPLLSETELLSLVKSETEWLSDRKRVSIELSTDVAVLIRMLSSHTRPQGLVVSAILRHFILTHPDDFRMVSKRLLPP